MCTHFITVHRIRVAMRLRFYFRYFFGLFSVDSFVSSKLSINSAHVVMLNHRARRNFDFSLAETRNLSELCGYCYWPLLGPDEVIWLRAKVNMNTLPHSSQSDRSTAANWLDCPFSIHYDFVPYSSVRSVLCMG